MSTEQEQWAAQIRKIPTVFRGELLLSDDPAILHRPAASEWPEFLIILFNSIQNRLLVDLLGFFSV
jgi:hypothetical protein